MSMFGRVCRNFSGFSRNCGKCISNNGHRLRSNQASPAARRDVEELFIDPQVQLILRRVTGFDIEKIFHTRKTLDPQPPKYKLLTDSQLEQEVTDAIEQGKKFLQMPPYMKPWSEESSHILSEDPEIEAFDPDNVNYVFTDISFGIPPDQRAVVIREPNGVLRVANSPERNRILNIYFPREGRQYQTPSLFNDENLERLLEERKYEYMLDSACVQFEPNDPEYIRVVHRTYEHVNTTQQFHNLRSTRHFGGMTFYLTLHKKIDALLIDMLQRNLLSDAADLVRLFHIVHPQSKSALESQNIENDTEIIQKYASTESKQGGRLELALQGLNEQNSKQ